MSRCLPYPLSLGYSAKIAGSGTLIGSIKLLRETKKDAITEEKEERKKGEKKVKREKKERVKEEANVIDRGKKRKHKEEKAYKLAQGTNDDSEPLERSNITEEFGQPCFPPIPCTSDTSEDSNRRKRHCPNLETPETGIRAKGTILRIRLAPKKPETATSIVVTPLTVKEELRPISTIIVNPVVLRQTNEQPSSSRRNESSRDKKIQRIDLLYKELVDNWVPPSFSSLESVLSDKDDELGWLNERKVQRCEQPKTDVNITSTSSTLWPQARFLPDAELYALPFAVPF